MSDTWHVRFIARDFGAANQFLTARLWKSLPNRWVLSLLGGTYGFFFFVGLFALWRTVEEWNLPYGRWFVAIFAAAFVVGTVASVASRRIWRRGTEALWGANTTPDTVRLDATGVEIEGGMGLIRVPWRIVQEIVRDGDYVYFLYRGVACLYVPAPGFESRTDFDDFEARARELLMASRPPSIGAQGAGSLPS